MGRTRYAGVFAGPSNLTRYQSPIISRQLSCEIQATSSKPRRSNRFASPSSTPNNADPVSGFPTPPVQFTRHTLTDTQILGWICAVSNLITQWNGDLTGTDLVETICRVVPLFVRLINQIH